jgi:hypothetical protein
MVFFLGETFLCKLSIFVMTVFTVSWTKKIIFCDCDCLWRVFKPWYLYVMKDRAEEGKRWKSVGEDSRNWILSGQLNSSQKSNQPDCFCSLSEGITSKVGENWIINCCTIYLPSRFFFILLYHFVCNISKTRGGVKYNFCSLSRLGDFFSTNAQAHTCTISGLFTRSCLH